jgi:hypothetical protein
LARSLRATSAGLKKTFKSKRKQSAQIGGLLAYAHDR